MFAEYVNAFLQIKQQASGWPEWCESEGIKLQREKIEKNAELRAVTKLCRNSFWGKFGQRSNLKQTEIVKTRKALIKLLTSPDIEVLSTLFVNDELLYVNWQNI